MDIEIEAKMHLEDLAPLEDTLKRLGARPVSILLEISTFFDRPDHSLRNSDQGLRLRVEHSVMSPGHALALSRQLAQGLAKGVSPAAPPAGLAAGDAPRVILTHKGPRQKGPIKARSEIEVVVGAAQAAQELLIALGFEPGLCFEKLRRRWLIDQCRIELDTMPYLGHFVEIEGPSEAVVMQTRRQLGLEDLPLVWSSYPSLLAAYLQQHQLPRRYVPLAPPVTEG